MKWGNLQKATCEKSLNISFFRLHKRSSSCVHEEVLQGSNYEELDLCIGLYNSTLSNLLVVYVPLNLSPPPLPFYFTSFHLSLCHLIFSSFEEPLPPFSPNLTSTNHSPPPSLFFIPYWTCFHILVSSNILPVLSCGYFKTNS